MNKEKNDGGPAFPEITLHSHNNFNPSWGMSLRDYFAGQYMASVAASDSYQTNEWAEKASLDAYRFADAMLKARDIKL